MCAHVGVESGPTSAYCDLSMASSLPVPIQYHKICLHIESPRQREREREKERVSERQRQECPAQLPAKWDGHLHLEGEDG